MNTQPLAARRTMQRAATFLIAVLALSFLSMPGQAAADPGPYPQAGGGVFPSLGVAFSNGQELSARNVTLLRVRVDDNAEHDLMTYCIEQSVGNDTGTGMHEGSWSDFPGSNQFPENARKVLWVLNHSYPLLSLDEVKSQLQAAGVDVSGLTKEEAVAATQSSVWHFSERTDLTEVQGDNQNVWKLYEYLTGDANVGTDEAEPVSLSLTPESATGTDGTDLGPITVSSNVTDVELQADLPAGTELITETGAKARLGKQVDDGDKFYLRVAKGTPEGSAAVEALTGDRVLSGPGRIFFGANSRTQTLILAQPRVDSASATATFSWTKSLTEVTPAEATFADECGTEKDTYTVPETEGVDYFVDGQVVEAGTHPGSGTVTVTAQPQAGYTLTGTTEWTHEFTDEPCDEPSESPSPTPGEPEPSEPTDSPTPSPGEPENPNGPLPDTGAPANLAILAVLACALVGGGVMIVRRRVKA